MEPLRLVRDPELHQAFQDLQDLLEENVAATTVDRSRFRKKSTFIPSFNLHPAIQIFFSLVMGPYLLGHAIEPKKLEPLKTEFNSTLKNLEEKFLQGKPFIAGEHISIADLVAIEELMQPVPGGVVFHEDRPVLAAWKERVEKAIGEDLFREAHQKLLHDSKLQHLSQGRRQGFKNMSQKIQ